MTRCYNRLSGPCQEPAGIAGVAEEVVEGVDGIVYFNLEELKEVLARWGGK